MLGNILQHVQHEIGRFRSRPIRNSVDISIWWRGLDSNQRRLSQRIYSPSPLTARAPLRMSTKPRLSRRYNGKTPSAAGLPCGRVMVTGSAGVNLKCHRCASGHGPGAYRAAPLPAATAHPFARDVATLRATLRSIMAGPMPRATGAGSRPPATSAGAKWSPDRRGATCPDPFQPPPVARSIAGCASTRPIGRRMPASRTR